MWSGWTGEGVKTVLPCAAHASVVARLVAGQTPARAFESLAAHLHASAAALFPAGAANVTVERLGFAAEPVVAPAASLANAAAAEARARARADESPRHLALTRRDARRARAFPAGAC
jgi:acetylornithine deacetylase/succinyl-diaminopimelate desuccinylase-like protein